MFNEQEYANANPDLPVSWTDEEFQNHFNAYGFGEGRDVYWSATDYIALNTDLAAMTDAEAFSHWVTYGKGEGRAPWFQADEYIAANGDLASMTDAQALSHWTVYGMDEGRIQGFDSAGYLELNDDVPQTWTFAEALNHYYQYGQDEDRAFDAYVDEAEGVSLSIDDVTVTEGDSGTTTAQFTVTLSTAPGTDETVTVDYATADGTATTADTDYTAASGTLTFVEGETSKTIDVSVSGDTTVESDETFTVTLSDVTGTVGDITVTILDASGAGTITTDDLAVDTYTLTTDASSVTEGDSIVFTVTAVDVNGNAASVTAATVLKYQVAGVEVAGGTADPLTDLGIVNGTVTILEGESTGTITLTPSDDGVTEGYEGFNVSLLDDDFAVITTSSNVVIEDVANAGQSFVLTTGIDALVDFTGGAGNDTFTGGINAPGGLASLSTFTALDSIDGGGGDDVLNLGAITAVAELPSVTVANIETMNIAAALGFVGDVSSGYTGLTAVNVTQAGGAVDITAASTTDVDIAGVVHGTATVAVTGGKDVTVAHKLDSAGDAIAVDGAVDVTVTATDVLNAAGLTIGGTTEENTGAITVTSSGAEIVAATANLTMDAIAVTGGSTVSVTQNATSDMGTATTDTSANTITGGAITVTGGADSTTTAVTVIQDEEVDAVNADPAVTGVQETIIVTFGAMTSGETMIVNGLTFTAAKDLTAAQVAAAFAGMSNDDNQDDGGITDNGVYTDKSDTADWTSGAATDGATTSTVTFTEVTAGTGAALALGGTATTAATQAAGTTGVTAVTAVTGVLGVVNGAVVIDDDGTTAAITTIAVDGYGAGATLGGGGSLDALTTLSLANSDSGAVTLTSTSATLGLTVNDVDGDVNLSGSVTTLNLVTDTTASLFTGMAATALTNLNVSGDALVTTTDNLGALTTVTVAGSAGLTLAAANSATLTSIDASTTSGDVTASIDATAATYSGGSGVDTVTTTAVAPTKAITLGAGDDSVTLFTGTTAMGTAGTIDGGADTDTLSMVAADAVTASASTTFAGVVTNFERLTLTSATGAQTVDVTKLGNYNYVTSAIRTGVADILTIDELVSGGTVALTVAPTGADTTGSVTVNVTDAGEAGNTTDSLTLALSAAGALAAGRVVAADVETITISTTDTTTDVVAGTNAQTLTLVATAAETISISGNTDFTLTNTGNIAVTSINAGTMTGDLTVTAAGTIASTITGGSGDDTLTASPSAASASVAQVSTITYTDGAGNAAFATGDTITATVGGVVFSQVFDTNLDTTLDALAVKIQDAGGDSVTYTTDDDATAGVITITAAVAGTAFTADGGFTQAAASSITSVYAAGAVTEGTESNVVTFGELTAGQTLTIAGLTLTETDGGGMTDAEVAAAWESAVAGATPADPAKGTFGGTLDDWSMSTLTGVTAVATSAFANSNVTDLSLAGTGSGASSLVKTDGINDIDTLTLIEAVAITVGDTITATVTNGVSTYTTTAVAFNTNLDTTYDDLATAITALNGGASFTASNTTGVISVTDAVAGAAAAGSPITAISTSVVVDQVRTVTDVVAITTANVSTTPTADTLIGGAGDDTLVAGDLATLTGGAGNDTFDMTTVTASVNAYSTVTDFTSGDIIETTAAAFDSTGITLADTAVFLDYANTAITNTDAGDVTWFVFGTNTYVVDNNSNDATGFVNTSDTIIALTGVFDLGTDASFNTTLGTIELA